MRLPSRLVLSLEILQSVAVLTLARSMFFCRWPTVLAAAMLIIGVRAALRERTWGLGVILATASAFPVAAVLGFGPQWFWGVGIAGAIPFCLALRPMLRFDAAATVLFGGLAAATGVAGAFAWREAAYSLYYALHSCH